MIKYVLIILIGDRSPGVSENQSMREFANAKRLLALHCDKELLDSFQSQPGCATTSSRPVENPWNLLV